MKIDTSQVERRDGSRVTEVVAMYGTTVLDVQHIGQVESQRDSARSSIALGVLMMLVGGGAFAADVAQDWEGHRVRVEAAMESGRPAPPALGLGWGSVGIALAFLGLVPLVMGAMRLGDDERDGYVIGEGHEATFHVSTFGLPEAAGFPLVSGAEHEAMLAFTPHMTGFVTLGGDRVTLAELVSSGRAPWTGSSHAFPLPAEGLCVVHHAGVTFRVRSVAPGRRLAQERQIDKPFWFYNGASLAVLGALLMLAHVVPHPGFDMGLDDLTSAERFVRSMRTPVATCEQSANDPEDSNDDPVQATKPRAGRGPSSTKGGSGRITRSQPKDATPAMTRDLAPDIVARSAGILGLIGEQSGTFLASPYAGAFSVASDDDGAWGGSPTGLAEARPLAGLILVGTGRRGGGTGEGTVGLDEVGLSGGSRCRGRGGCGYGVGGRGSFGPRGKRVPQVRMAEARVCGVSGCGATGREVIRRVVRAHINEVRHCYDQGLTRNPQLKGRVTIQFTIDASGKVPAATVQDSTIGDQGVASCIAKAVRRWSFPKPSGAGHTMVNYPFVLTPG